MTFRRSRCEGGTWHPLATEFQPALWKLVMGARSKAMEMWSSLHGRVRRSVLPRVYACSLADKTSWACHTTRKASVRPLGVTCIMYVWMYVCMFRKAPERGLHPWQYAESEWVVSRGLCDRNGRWEDNRIQKEEGALAAGCGVSSTVARSTWQNARPERRCSLASAGCCVHVHDLDTFDWSRGADVIGNVEDVAFVY